EAVTIAKDSTGMLWTSFDVNGRMFVAHTIGGDDTQWSGPVSIPVAEGLTSSVDDDSGIIALDSGHIGVFWSNQITDKFYFATHVDGQGDTAGWNLEVAGSGSSISDDHFNMKLASDGRLFVLAKTSRTVPDQTLVGLFIRSTAGVWTPLIKVTNYAF